MKSDGSIYSDPHHLRSMGVLAVKVYVAGPMTGIKDWNIPAFTEMTTRLRDAGYLVVNPHELHEPSEDVAWGWYMRRDLPQLCTCDTIVLLRGWEFSKGARLEKHVADELGMTVIQWYELEKLGI